MQVLYRWWATLVFVAVVVQVGLAGYGAFFVIHKVDDHPVTESEFEDGFIPHSILGYSIVVAGLVLLVVGVLAGTGRWRLGRHGVLALLLVVQLLLAWIGFEVPAVGFFHPVNALLIFAVAASIVRDEWRRQVPESVPAATTHRP